MKTLTKDIFDIKGKKTGSINLPEEYFTGKKIKENTLKQVVVSLLSNRRKSLAQTKDRSEVSGGGRKPWRQKGTGRARHGSIRSPIWVGGGVTFGPTNKKNYTKKINKKLLKNTINFQLTEKLNNNEIFFVEDLSLEKPSTKQAKEIVDVFEKNFKDMSVNRKNKCLVVVDSFENKMNVVLSFRNIKGVGVKEFSRLDPDSLSKYKFLLFVGDVFNNNK